MIKEINGQEKEDLPNIESTEKTNGQRQRQKQSIRLQNLRQAYRS